jgi:phosphoserine phosphatase
MPGFPFGLVAIDIDGTLTIESGWRWYAERLGRLDEYEAADAAYRSGKVSENVHLRSLLALVAGTPITRFEEWMEATPKLSGITETVDQIREWGAIPVLLSHNPGYVSEWYARRFGFDDWDGTSDRPQPEVVEGAIGPPGEIVADKPGGLARLLARHPTRPSRAAHVGDGLADAAIFPRVGFGIALNSSLPEVIQSADISLDLSDLRGILESLRTARVRAVPEHIL